MPRITPSRRRLLFMVPTASMRPGRNAPDNLVAEGELSPQQWGFNEAGAKCPG